MSIIIYTDKPEKRLEYISDFLFRVVLGGTCECTTDKMAFRQSDRAKINYSHRSFSVDCLVIPVHPFLAHRPLKNWGSESIIVDTLPALFPVAHSSADLEFDLFSMAFFLLSRYEEYLPFSADQHQRFPAKESIAYQKHFLHLPLIDLWAHRLKRLLVKRFPALSFAPPTYRFRPSIDIDMAWSFRYKGWLRSLGAVFRDAKAGRLSALRQRFDVLTNQQPDPFYTFDYMEKLHSRLQLKPLYFWLLGQYGPYDKNSDPENHHFRQLIRQQSQQTITTGIHPSYQSNAQPERIAEEKALLEDILGKSILHSRQHFLMLRFPDTYRHLLAAGIEEDFSMGYASAIGFRAGTAHPFHWYDLEKETVTSLLVHPFQLMDVSLQQYLGYSPEEALAAAGPLVEVCREVGGQFVSIWHNSSLTEDENWKGWRKVYEGLLALAVDAMPPP